LNKWETEWKKNKKSFYIWKTKVNIFPTIWEKFDWYEKESLDIIFINHTITKPQVDPYKVLENVYYLLKKWWKLYITESWKIDFWVFKLFNEEFNVDIINSYYLNDKTILILEKI
jgi:hypothetical protein